MLYYKFLRYDMVSPIAMWQWPPIGEWTNECGCVEMCMRGYHAATVSGIPEFANDRLYLLEYDNGPEIKERNKVCGSRARLVQEVRTWTYKNIMLAIADVVYNWNHWSDNASRTFGDGMNFGEIVAGADALLERLMACIESNDILDDDANTAAIEMTKLATPAILLDGKLSTDGWPYSSHAARIAHMLCYLTRA